MADVVVVVLLHSRWYLCEATRLSEATPPQTLEESISFGGSCDLSAGVNAVEL